jgi:hypothetical protein
MQGAAGKKNGKTTYICASSQRKARTYVFFGFFLVVFCAFLGKGDSETQETN